MKTLFKLLLAASLLPQAAAADILAPLQPKDAFALESACAIVDIRFIQQPTLESAIDMLSPCMKALSENYGVRIAAGNGTLPHEEGMTGIQILISGHLPAGNPALEHLNYALSIRGNRLLTYEARIVTLHPLLKAQKTSMRVQKKLRELPPAFALESEMTDAPSIGQSGPVR